jgi:hypothetical protein
MTSFTTFFTSDNRGPNYLTETLGRWQREQGGPREDQQISGAFLSKRGLSTHHPLNCMEAQGCSFCVNQARRNDVLSCANREQHT